MKFCHCLDYFLEVPFDPEGEGLGGDDLEDEGLGCEDLVEGEEPTNFLMKVFLTLMS